MLLLADLKSIRIKSSYKNKVISPPGIILIRLLDLLEQVYICLRTDFMNIDVD